MVELIIWLIDKINFSDIEWAMLIGYSAISYEHWIKNFKNAKMGESFAKNFSKHFLSEIIFIISNMAFAYVAWRVGNRGALIGTSLMIFAYYFFLINEVGIYGFLEKIISNEKKVCFVEILIDTLLALTLSSIFIRLIIIFFIKAIS